jgi:hypothetical protein
MSSILKDHYYKNGIRENYDASTQQLLSTTSANLASCPSTSAQTNSLEDFTTHLCENFKESMENTLASLGVKACSYHKASADIGYSTDALGLIKAEAHGTADYQDAVGCETISVQGALNAQINQNLNCTLSQIQSQGSAYTQQGASIVLEITDLTADNLNLGTVQNLSCKGNVVNFANSAVQQSLINSTIQAANSVTNAFSNIDTQGYSDPYGSKTIQESLNVLSSLISNNTISQIVQESINQVCQLSTQDISLSKIKLTGNANISLAQNSTNEYILNSIANSVVGQINNNNIQSSIQNSQTSSSTAKTTSKPTTPMSKTSITALIVVAVILVLGAIFGGIGYYYYQKQKKDALTEMFSPSSSLLNTQPPIK